MVLPVLPEKRPGLRSGSEAPELVEKGERIGDRVRGGSGYLPPVVYIRQYALIPPKRPEIYDLAILPNQSTNLPEADQRLDYAVFSVTSDVPARIDRGGDTTVVGSGERTQVGHRTVLPLERVEDKGKDTVETFTDESVAVPRTGNRRRSCTHRRPPAVYLVGRSN